ncbi:MAG: gamma-glutamylcyclotransferase [Planctomycetes bacterium]|nr:gamma-glutamylcyclotransferase [Planctomycetota bacterium]MCB9906075.1 gamma-glutamylcyclotransferase [Planctomycetota bacterium]
MQKPTHKLPADPRETLIFVYGRMRRGEENHHFLSQARFVREAETAACFELVDLGGLPGLIQGGASSVQGELYLVTSSLLTMIDELEDHPETFRRTRIELSDGSFAEGYVMPSSQASCFPRLVEGRWRRRA